MTETTNDQAEQQAFYMRADAFIDLANKQMAGVVEGGEVSASFMFALARYNAHISANDFPDASAFKQEKKQVVEYFVDQYRTMLEGHVEDYVVNFDTYLQRGE